MIRIGGISLNRIDREINTLLELSAAGELPGYKLFTEDNSFYAEAPSCRDLSEYFSGENDALERRLETLWADDAQMKKCIPIILAAVEKSRGQKTNAVVRTELYNYTM